MDFSLPELDRKKAELKPALIGGSLRPPHQDFAAHGA